MCLYTTPDVEPSIAENDIEVFKVVSKATILHYTDNSVTVVYTSPFQGMKYHIGAEYESHLVNDILEVCDDERFSGLMNIAVARADNDEVFDVGCVEEGLHSFESYEDAVQFAVYRLTRYVNGGPSRFGGKYAVLRCVIPAGSKYYKGLWPYGVYKLNFVDSYASSALKVIEEFKEIV